MRTSVAGVVAVLSTHGISTDERLARLNALDLTNVKRKLMEPEPEGKGWTRDQCDEAEKWYKRFLAATIAYPDARLVPNLPIDIFWHQHILDTAAYRNDCSHVLGYFLDHYPYFGLNGDAQERDDCFDETNVFYRAMFGEDCTVMSFGVRTSHGAGCSPPCSTQACHGGGTCSACMVDRRPRVHLAAGCNHNGSGTGCGQGGRGR